MSKKARIQTDEYQVIPYDFKDYNQRIDQEEVKKQGIPFLDTSKLCGRLLTEARLEAEKVLRTAREEAEVLVKEAKEHQEEAYKLGYQEGFEKGHREGFKKVYSEHEKKLQKEIEVFQEDTAKFIEGMQEKKEELLELYLEDLKKITLTISEKIIRTSLKTSGEVIKRMIISATDKLKRTQWAKIYITSGDASRLVNGDASLIQELSHLSDNIKIIVMNHEEEGNCIVELPEEIIDISINTQLQNIKDIIDNARL